MDLRVPHLLTYSLLLGSTTYQTLVVGPLSYLVLPRSSFATLQRQITPPFFALQTVLPIVLAATDTTARKAIFGGSLVVGNNSSSPNLSASGGGLSLPGSSSSSSSNLLLTVGGLIGVMFATGLLNWIWIGPATTKCMMERKHQG